MSVIKFFQVGKEKYVALDEYLALEERVSALEKQGLAHENGIARKLGVKPRAITHDQLLAIISDVAAHMDIDVSWEPASPGRYVTRKFPQPRLVSIVRDLDEDAVPGPINPPRKKAGKR